MQSPFVALAPSAGAWSEHRSPDGRSYFYNASTGESTWDRPAELSGAAALPDPALAFGANAGYGGAAYGQPGGFMAQQQMGYGYGPSPAAGYGYGGAAVPYNDVNMGPGPPIQKGKRAHGPMGSNLFVFHIPNHTTTRQVFDLFAPFGNVVSARIMVERDTGRSRGFGFVSFDNSESADAAIRQLDGFTIGGKRLKVSLKKEITDGPHDPYNMGQRSGDARMATGGGGGVGKGYDHRGFGEHAQAGGAGGGNGGGGGGSSQGGPSSLFVPAGTLPPRSTGGGPNAGALGGATEGPAGF